MQPVRCRGRGGEKESEAADLLRNSRYGSEVENLPVNPTDFGETGSSNVDSIFCEFQRQLVLVTWLSGGCHSLGLICLFGALASP